MKKIKSSVWMPQGQSRTLRTLGVFRDTNQPEVGFLQRYLSGQQSKVAYLIKKSESLEDGMRSLVSTLESLGIMPYFVSIPSEITQKQVSSLVSQMMEGNDQLEDILLEPTRENPQPAKEAEAEAMWRELTIEDWTEALDSVARGRC